MEILGVGVGEIYFYKVIFILTRIIFFKVFCTLNFDINMLNKHFIRLQGIWYVFSFPLSDVKQEDILNYENWTPNAFTGDTMFVSLHWNQAYNLAWT